MDIFLGLSEIKDNCVEFAKLILLLSLLWFEEILYSSDVGVFWVKYLISWWEFLNELDNEYCFDLFWAI